MRLRSSILAAVVVALAASGAGRHASADGADPIVARVGAKSVTRSELERRLASIPSVQLSTFGATPEAARRAFLEKVVIPEMLFAQGAEADKLAERPDMRLRIQDALRAATMSAIRKEVASAQVSDADVAKYFADNQAKFQTPERINVWRILVKTKDEAQAILDEVKKPGGDKKWKDLAREKSTDRATNERGGNLGFLGPDGHSSEVTVKAEPALFEAAKKVQNGEFVPDPVPEDGAFAVVWRRGSTPAVSRTLEQETPAIRAALTRHRTEARTKETLERLRKENVTTPIAYDLLALVEPTPGPAGSARKREAGPRPGASGKPAPEKGEGGYRLPPPTLRCRRRTRAGARTCGPCGR